MKRFFTIMVNDYREESFTKREYVIYGVIVPIVAVIVCSIPYICAL